MSPDPDAAVLPLDTLHDEAESRLFRLFEHAPIAVAIVRGEDLRYTLVNPAYQAIPGTPDAAMVGRSVQEVFPNLPAEGIESLRTVLRTGASLRLAELEANVGEGRCRTWWNVEHAPLFGADGRPHAVLIMAHEVTEQVLARQRLEAALAAAEEAASTLGAVMEHVPEGITIADAPDVRIRRVSRHGQELTGRPPEVIEGITAVVDEHARTWGIFHRDGATPARDADLPLTRAVRQGEVSYDEEWLIRRPDGSEITILTNAGPIRDSRGRITGGVIAWRDISARKETERALRESSRTASERLALLEAVYRSAPVGLCLIDHDLRYVQINDQLARMNGLPIEAHLGRTIADVLPVWAGVLEPRLRRVLETGQVLLDQELSGTGAGGAVFHVCASFVPVCGEDGQVFGVQAVVQDVTEQRRSEAERTRLWEEAEAARRTAEEANRAKTQFLSAMSHELRTPLNAIAGYVDLLDLGIHGTLDDAQRHALARIKHAQEHLLTLIEDVLSFARLEAGRIELRTEDVRLDELLAGVGALVEPQAQTRGVAYSRRSCDAGLLLRADSGRVRQILLNLLGNAIKFTNPGGWIAVVCEADAEQVHIRVTDNGRGIPSEKKEAIFAPFVQVEQERDGQGRGVGLGLAISRDLARAMGGDLTVESEPGGGSTFTLTLRRSAAE